MKKAQVCQRIRTQPAHTGCHPFATCPTTTCHLQALNYSGGEASLQITVCTIGSCVQKIPCIDNFVWFSFHPYFYLFLSITDLSRLGQKIHFPGEGNQVILGISLQVQQTWAQLQFPDLLKKLTRGGQLFSDHQPNSELTNWYFNTLAS